MYASKCMREPKDATSALAPQALAAKKEMIERIRVQRFNFQPILLLLLVGLIMQQSRRWTPNAIATERADILAKRNIPHSSPLLALYQLFQPIPTDINWNNFSKLDIIELSNYGFTLKKDEPYPFLKPKIYDSPLPFATPPHGESNRPNVLLIFTEGFSARSLDAYDHRYPNLTPNIAQFARSSMVVDRFYNHTTATYRGLHGQLCSLYPQNDGYDPATKHGLPAQNYLCLTDLFNEANYTTTFINSHPQKESFVDEMTARLNFHQTISGEEFSSAFLAGEPLKHPFALSDRQLFRGLLPALEKISASNGSNQPFFVAMYNSETHANVDVVDDGITYGDGENNALNTIHNYDRAFGLFWQEFSKSDLAKNTVIILTADHCHYSEKSFVSAFAAEDYQYVFIDRVPLIIHDPRTSLPPRFDAMNSTSVDLAPTLAHYLQLKNGPNPFFGRSIFEKGADSFNKIGISGYGGNTYLIDSKTISYRENPNQHMASLKILAKYLRYSSEMEAADRIWDPALRR